MSTTEIFERLPQLSRVDRRAILNRLLELDEDADILEERRQQADKAFQMLDAMEAEVNRVVGHAGNGPVKSVQFRCVL